MTHFPRKRRMSVSRKRRIFLPFFPAKTAHLWSAKTAHVLLPKSAHLFSKKFFFIFLKISKNEIAKNAKDAPFSGISKMAHLFFSPKIVMKKKQKFVYNNLLFLKSEIYIREIVRVFGKMKKREKNEN